MSTILKNKQIIHIATEIVIVIGMVFYFSSKNKKLLQHIEDLSQRLEDQEDLIQKHEQIIRQLVQVCNKINQPPSNEAYGVHKQRQKNTRHSLKIRNRTNKSASPSISSSASPSTSVRFNDNDEIIEPNSQSDKITVEEYSSDDSDLDAEIADELEELKQQDSFKNKNPTKK